MVITDSPMDSMPSKKTRVFFTEEQKETLRMAYAQDPYPNPGTIEQLANSLGVSSKTIVNWFHNHRMRAKQQQHGSTSSSGSDTGNGIKAEPEDLSNHSDALSGSDGCSRYQGSNHSDHAGSQWMFPSFEPVFSRRGSVTSTDGSSCTLGDSAGRDKLRELKDDLVSPNMDSERDQPEDLSTQRRQTPPPPIVRSNSSVNKRKCAKPQWAIEGVQLDRSRQVDLEDTTRLTDTEQLSESSPQPPLAGKEPTVRGSDTPDTTTKDNESDKDILTASNVDDAEQVSKIHKLQKAIEASDMEWEDEDRSEKIERLSKSITQEEEEDWEF